VLDSTDKRHSQSGFTIVELTASIAISSVLMIGLMAFMFNSFALITRNGTLTEMSNDSQNLLRTTVETIRYGAGVRQNNTITDPNQPAGGWTTSNTNFVIVISVPALNSSRNYILDSDTGEPYLNELVYYKSGTQLKQRTLANPGATGNTLKTTCPDNLATTACPADKQLINNVDSMVFTLYDQDNIQTTNPLIAKSVKINLDMKKNSVGGSVNFTNSIRVTLRNNFT